VLDELRRRGLIEARIFERRLNRNRPPPQVPKREAKDRTSEIQFILGNCRPTAGTMVDIYFRWRSLEPFDCPDLLYHDCLTDLTRTGGWPAMVAIVRDPLTGELRGLHRTYLRDGGVGKAPIAKPKAMLGPCGGGAVMLRPAGELLAVGEGIENCAAAMQACATLPVWAALTTSGLKALPLPPMPIASRVIILADHDSNGAGQGAARAAAQRWLAEGRRVWIAMPPKPDTDFNDILIGRGRPGHRCRQRTASRVR
jgi:putative DNA primase/helicase